MNNKKKAMIKNKLFSPLRRDVCKADREGFTLAELLVAMLIFALLAVMLVPNVANNAEQELFVTQLKKVQNDVQQALLIMMARNQGTLQMMCPGADPSQCFTDEIAERLEHSAIYSEGNARNCDQIDAEARAKNRQEQGGASYVQAMACLFQQRQPQFLNRADAQFTVNGGANWNGPFFVTNLKNGASVAAVFDPRCHGNGIDNALTGGNLANVINNPDIDPDNICGYIEVDVNGSKVPNTVGKDIHYFWIVDQDGLVPFGEVDIFTCGTPEAAQIADLDNPGAMRNNPARGRIRVKPRDTNNLNEQLGCTARIMQNGKIDYY